MLGLATIAVGIAYTMLFMPAITHTRGWWVVAGVWPPLMAARYAANGALGYLYSADPIFAAGPLAPIVLIPVIIVGDTLRLTDNYGFNVAHPTMWLVYGPYGLAMGIVLLYGARAVAHRVWVAEGSASRQVPPRHVWTQVAMAVLVLVPAAVVYGHFEEVLALAFVLLGIRSMLSSRYRRAALWLGLAIATKQWALLGLPILIAAAPARLRAKTLVRSLVLPAALMTFMLFVDWKDTWPALVGPRVISQFGHGALWVARSSRMIVGAPERLGEVAVAVALGWWLRGVRRPRLLLAGFGVAFLSRLFFEPVVLAYYLAPSLALLFLHERGSGTSGLRTATGGVAILLFFLVHPNPWLWWTVTAAVALWLATPALRDVIRREEMPPEPMEQPSMAPASADLTHVGI